MLVSIFCPSHYIERKKDKQEVNAKTAKAGEEAMAMTGVHQGRPPCSKNSIKMCNFGNLHSNCLLGLKSDGSAPALAEGGS